MSYTIKVEREVMEDFLAHNKDHALVLTINIEAPPKPEKWEPSQTGYAFSASSGVMKSKGNMPMTAGGSTRISKAQTERAYQRSREMNRLSAYVDEFEPDNKGWDNRKKNYSIYYYSKVWLYEGTYSKRVGEVYMSEETAEVLVDKLNSGEVEL